MAKCRRFDSSLTSGDTSEFTFHLQHDAGYLPDVLKDYKRLIDKYSMMMQTCCQPWGMVNGAGKLGGVFFVGDVEFGHEGVFYAWLWDPKVYTSTTHRFMDGYLCHVAESNRLDRMVCRTPDERLLELLERLGFKLEGRFARGYRCGGRSSVLYQARRLFNFGGVV